MKQQKSVKVVEFVCSLSLFSLSKMLHHSAKYAADATFNKHFDTTYSFRGKCKLSFLQPI